MPKRAITEEFFECLVELFRVMPGNYTGVAKYAKLDPRTGGHCSFHTTRKAWQIGWEDKGFPPIQRIVADSDMVLTRAALEDDKLGEIPKLALREILDKRDLKAKIARKKEKSQQKIEKIQKIEENRTELEKKQIKRKRKMRTNRWEAYLEDTYKTEVSDKQKFDRARASEEKLLSVLNSDDSLLRERARVDAIRARVEETKLVRQSRDNSIKLLETSKNLLQGMGEISRSVARYFEDFEVNNIEDVNNAVHLLWRISTSVKSATECGYKSILMERLLLGLPTENENENSANDEDSLKILEEAAKTFSRVRERQKKNKSRKSEEMSEDVEQNEDEEDDLV